MFANTDKRHVGAPWFVVETNDKIWGTKESGWFITWACNDLQEAKGAAANRSVPVRIWKVTGEIVFESGAKNQKLIEVPKIVTKKHFAPIKEEIFE